MPAIGDTNDAGEFELSMYGKNDGAIVGENTVTVVMLSPGDGGAMPPDPTKIAAGGGNMPLSAEIGSTKKEGGVSLPAVYGDPKNSGLKVTVRPGGESDVKLELK